MTSRCGALLLALALSAPSPVRAEADTTKQILLACTGKYSDSEVISVIGKLTVNRPSREKNKPGPVVRMALDFGVVTIQTVAEAAAAIWNDVKPAKGIPRLTLRIVPSPESEASLVTSQKGIPGIHLLLVGRLPHGPDLPTARIFLAITPVEKKQRQTKKGANYNYQVRGTLTVTLPGGESSIIQITEGFANVLARATAPSLSLTLPTPEPGYEQPAAVVTPAPAVQPSQTPAPAEGIPPPPISGGSDEGGVPAPPSPN